MMTRHGAALTVENCGKTFADGTCALARATLDIAQSETLVLLGPSGCGKTTLLRIVAGLETPDVGGRVLFDGADLTRQPIEKRNVGMVFQSYALFPNMSVADNIGYGLKIRRVAKADRAARVAELVALTNLGGLEDRRIDQLSGGQRQRVAIGRAIVREPKAFLFDEPLSNLDAALRVQMRLEVTRLQKQLGTTAIYVTHDQVEAMTMADKIVVLNAGRIEQYGSPIELYQRPANLFVAGFIGSPKMNLITGDEATQRGAATIGVRPEHVAVVDDGQGWPGKVVIAEHLGSDTFLYVDAGALGTLTVRVVGEKRLSAGDAVTLRPEPNRIYRFDSNGQSIFA